VVGLGAGAIAFSAGNWALHRGAVRHRGRRRYASRREPGRWPWQDYAGRAVRSR